MPYDFRARGKEMASSMGGKSGYSRLNAILVKPKFYCLGCSPIPAGPSIWTLAELLESGTCSAVPMDEGMERPFTRWV